MERADPIRLFKPCGLGEEELGNIQEAFERSWLGLGPFVDQLENQWGDYIGRSHNVGVNSCTAALHLALLVKRFPKGSKVLVPAITFISTAHAVLYCDLEPIFVDVDDRTLSLDLEDLERKITDDSVAVIPVHLGGHPAPMDGVMEIARHHDLWVVEDCAESAGGAYQGEKLGTWGDVGCFSLEEKKNFTSGDGGLMSLDDEELDRELRRLRWLGIDRDTWKRVQLGQEVELAEDEAARHWYYEVSMAGFKYNMNDLAAAVGLGQLQKLDEMNAARARLIRRYLDGLDGLDYLRPIYPYEEHLDEPGYWLFGIRVAAEHRDRLIVYLREQNVSTGVHFMPLPLHPLYHSYDVDIPVAKRAWKEMITLPLHPELTDEEVDYTVEALHRFRHRI